MLTKDTIDRWAEAQGKKTAALPRKIRVREITLIEKREPLLDEQQEKIVDLQLLDNGD